MADGAARFHDFKAPLSITNGGKEQYYVSFQLVFER